MASSTDVERFFKVTKNECSDQRASLKADMVNEFASLNVWLTDKYEFKDIKEEVRLARMQRFASLNARSLVQLEKDDGDTDKKNDSEEEKALELTEWIYNIYFLLNL